MIGRYIGHWLLQLVGYSKEEPRVGSPNHVHTVTPPSTAALEDLVQ